MGLYIGNNKYKVMIGNQKGSFVTEDSGLLPSGYTQVEYIESTGTQYINTGYIFNGIKSEINAEFSLTQIISGWSTLSATQKDRNTRWGGIQFQGLVLYCTAGNVQGDHGISYAISTLDKKYKVKILTNSSTKKNTMTVENTVGEINFDGSINTNTSLCLFAKNTNGSKSEFGRAKLYKYSLAADDVLVLNLIPCKNPNNVVGMYDLVNNTFYTNSGTGDFIAGPEV